MATLIRGVNLLVQVGVPSTTLPTVTFGTALTISGARLIQSIANEPTLYPIETGKDFSLNPGKMQERLYFFGQSANGILNESSEQVSASLTASVAYEDNNGRLSTGLEILMAASQIKNKAVWFRAERFLKVVGSNEIYTVQCGLFLVGANTSQSAQSNTVDDAYTLTGTGDFYSGYVYK
jgi:hypothetical protein